MTKLQYWNESADINLILICYPSAALDNNKAFLKHYLYKVYCFEDATLTIKNLQLK